MQCKINSLIAGSDIASRSAGGAGRPRGRLERPIARPRPPEILQLAPRPCLAISRHVLALQPPGTLACHDRRCRDQTRKPRLRGRRRQAPAPDGALGLFRQGRLPARADLQRRRRLRAAALRGDRRARAARRRPEAAHHHQDRRRRAPPDGRGQRHRHEPRRDGRGARHHRALGHARLRGAAGGEQGRGEGATPDRAVRRRLLLRLHGRRPRRRDLAPRRQRRGLALVVGRQGHLHGRAGCARRGAGARHPRHRST